VKKRAQFLLSFLQLNDLRLRRRFRHFRLFSRCTVVGSSAQPFPHHSICFHAISCRIRFRDSSFSTGHNWNVFFIVDGFEDHTRSRMYQSFATMHTRLINEASQLLLGHCCCCFIGFIPFLTSRGGPGRGQTVQKPSQARGVHEQQQQQQSLFAMRKL